jgi:hypothetical protein
MKTVSFSNILAGVCQLVGLDRATLNDKSFGAMRDFCSKRIGTIWDREAWPDNERFFDTNPGTPITAIEYADDLLLMETGDPLCTESDIDLFVSNAANTRDIKCSLNIYFPRIYLEQFNSDAFNLATIGDSYVEFKNPIYTTLEDGSKRSLAATQYRFSYESLDDESGEFVSTITVAIPYSTVPTYTYRGVNDLTTVKVIFKANPQYLIQLPEDALQAMSAHNNDSRQTTRTVIQDFTVEDFYVIPEIIDFPGTEVFAGPNYTNYSYLRFLNSDRKYIQYRTQPIELTGKGYSVSVAYAYNAQIYFDWEQQSGSYTPTNSRYGSVGDFWIMSFPGGIDAGIANPRNPYYLGLSVWRRLEIPHRFKDYLINGTAADFLRSEGRPEEANICDQLAEAAVQQQIDVLIRQQGQTQRIDMVYTY